MITVDQQLKRKLHRNAFRKANNSNKQTQDRPFIFHGIGKVPRLLFFAGEGDKNLITTL